MQQKIQKVILCINENDKRWYSLKPEFERIFGKKSVEVLLNELEEALYNLPPKKLPHYCLAFYLALLIIANDEKEEIVEIVKNKKSYELMKKGMRIFLSAKSPDFKYEGRLLDSRFKNKYQFVAFFSGYVPDYDFELRGFINILELIYMENKQSFWELLSYDVQNLFVLCSLVGGRLSFDYEELIPFLTSENELRANGAFFYMMNSFSYLAMKYQRDKTKENGKILQQEVNILNGIFQKLPAERRIHFIVNYLFEEELYPSFFNKELQTADIKVIINELMKQDLKNLYKLIKMDSFMRICQNKEIEHVFMQNFLCWIENDANINIWEATKNSIKGILELISVETKKKLLKELAIYRDKLFISFFDRQVRFALYLNEKDKERVIEDIFSWGKDS